MSWEPKYKELKEKALDMSLEYKAFVEAGVTSIEAVKSIAINYQMAVKSVYRYLHYAGVELRGRSERKKVVDKV